MNTPELIYNEKCACFVCRAYRENRTSIFEKGPTHEFQNLDGTFVVLSPAMSAYLDYVKYHRGYSEEFPVRGKMGHSELCMHMGIAEEEAIRAFVRPGDYRYAYVVTASGKIVDGSFHRFEGGDISLS